MLCSLHHAKRKIMTTLDLITKQDLEHFKTELFEELRKLGINSTTEQAGTKCVEISLEKGQKQLKNKQNNVNFLIIIK